MGQTGDKYSVKIVFDIKIEIGIFEICNVPISITSDTFNFGTKLGRTGGKYLIKTIFDIRMKIGIFEISNLLNFNKS